MINNNKINVGNQWFHLDYGLLVQFIGLYLSKKQYSCSYIKLCYQSQHLHLKIHLKFKKVLACDDHFWGVTVLTSKIFSNSTATRCFLQGYNS